MRKVERKAMKLLFYVTAVVFLAGLAGPGPARGAAQEFPVPPPPLSEGIFPCSQCHKDLPVNKKKRELKDEHTDLKLHHAETLRWCLDCHNAANRDKLHLLNGDLIDFQHSYELCGQCHGNVYRDWRAGIHGKRTGFFAGSGQRMYLLCVACHNPHDPAFKPIKPEPAPFRPTDKRNAR
jgi:hypothetical protein